MPSFFKIPLQAEVEAYITLLNPGWPKAFVQYYAQRFWDYYHRQGWKLSNNVAMKDWKAAFRHQWNRIRNVNDTEEFNRFVRDEPANPDHKPNRQIEAVYRKYLKHPTLQEDKDFLEIYDELKKYPDFRFSIDQVKICRAYGPEKGKAIAVKMYFDRLALGKKAM